MSIHGLILEVRVTGCRKLRDTEFFTRQDPYVFIEYATTKVRTSTCTDGGRNPTFDEKFHIPLIEGLQELNVVVWNSNTFTHDDFIGSGRVYLHKVLANGYDDSSWPLQTRHNRSAGEVKLIMRVDVSAMKNKMGRSVTASTTHSVSPLPMPAAAPVPTPAPAPAPALASALPYTAVPPSYPPTSAYPAATAYPAPTPSQAPYTAPAYPPPPQQPYPPPPAGYPPPAYPPQPYEQPYPPQPYGQQPYPPLPMVQSPYPPVPYPGTYPPRPY